MDAVVGVDPGREKCGLAVLHPDGRVLLRAVVPAEELESHLRALAERYRVKRLVVGDKTGSRAVVERLDQEGLAAALGGIAVVDEHLSSVEGRALYWRSRPPKGWRRFIPEGMRTPPEPYDGWVAEVLVRRFLAAEEGH